MKKIKLLFTMTCLFCTANLYAMEEGDNQINLQKVVINGEPRLVIEIPHTDNQQNQINDLNNRTTYLERRMKIQEDGSYITLQKQALQKGRGAVLKLVLNQEILGLTYVTLGYFMSTYDQLTPSDH